MKYLLIVILLTSPAFATEPKKREFRVIQPKNVKLVDSQEPESANKDLPQHNKERVYYGPETTLFPTPDLSSFPKIKFSTESD